VPSIEKIRLFENSTKSKVTGISDNAEGKGGIREGEDWGDRKGVNEGAKSGFLRCGPNVGDVFLCESKERVCNLGVIFDKATIEVAEA
jgi:hypothetical protein